MWFDEFSEYIKGISSVSCIHVYIFMPFLFSKWYLFRKRSFSFWRITLIFSAFYVQRTLFWLWNNYYSLLRLPEFTFRSVIQVESIKVRGKDLSSLYARSPICLCATLWKDLLASPQNCFDIFAGCLFTVNVWFYVWFHPASLITCPLLIPHCLITTVELVHIDLKDFFVFLWR